MSKGYKYRHGRGEGDGGALFNRDLETLCSDSIYAPTLHQLNDLHEGFVKDNELVHLLEEFGKLIKCKNNPVIEAYQNIRKKMEGVGIYSLCTNAINETLWTHYASGHTGFVIEYDLDYLEGSLNYSMCIPLVNKITVNYSDKTPIADLTLLLHKDVNTFLKLFLGHKSNKWSYEEEVRLITELTGVFRIDHRAITGIYFGCRMSDDDIDLLMQRLKGRGLNYYKMNLIQGEYGLTPIKIPDNYADSDPYISSIVNYDLNDIFMDDIYVSEVLKYKSRLIEALEIVRYNPLITKIYLAHIEIGSNGRPVFKVFADMIYSTSPIREFKFELGQGDQLISLD